MPKPGYFTPSRFSDAMTNGKGKDTPGKTAIDYAWEIAMERLGVQKPEVYAPALTWGTENEDLALQQYSFLTFHEVERVLMPCIHPEFPFVAGTPDGLIGTEGIVEVKCPYNPKNHLMNFINNEQVKQYTPQMQGYMWIFKSKWCDFESFDPRYPIDLRTKIVRVDRDDEYIEKLAARITALNDIANDIVRKARPDLEADANEMIFALKNM